MTTTSGIITCIAIAGGLRRRIWRAIGVRPETVPVASSLQGVMTDRLGVSQQRRMRGPAHTPSARARLQPWREVDRTVWRRPCPQAQRHSSSSAVPRQTQRSMAEDITGASPRDAVCFPARPAPFRFSENQSPSGRSASTVMLRGSPQSIQPLAPNSSAASICARTSSAVYSRMPP